MMAPPEDSAMKSAIEVSARIRPWPMIEQVVGDQLHLAHEMRGEQDGATFLGEFGEQTRGSIGCRRGRDR